MRSLRAVLPIVAGLAFAAALGFAALGYAAATDGGASSPSTSEPEKEGVLFYSDLGPNSIDVSAYPSEQRRNYAVYARACSRCHGLARSINAPYTSRGWWEFYISGMRLRGKVSGRPFSREEIKSVLDFLEYDARVRKIEKSADFEKSAAELQARFNAYVDKRMNDLQKKPQPRLLP